MTDRMAALTALSLHDVAERVEALDDFYARYSNDPLIVDKWLSLQAADSGARDARARQGADRAYRVFDVEPQSRARADRSLRDVEPEGIQPRRRWRL